MNKKAFDNLKSGMFDFTMLPVEEAKSEFVRVSRKLTGETTEFQNEIAAMAYRAASLDLMALDSAVGLLMSLGVPNHHIRAVALPRHAKEIQVFMDVNRRGELGLRPAQPGWVTVHQQWWLADGDTIYLCSEWGWFIH